MIIPSIGRVLIKPLKREDALTKSGVIIPGEMTQAENLSYGEVLSHTPSTEVPQLEPGTKVFFSRYSTSQIIDDLGKGFVIVSDLDVMAIEQ
jgi:co-chaperonin GroES (HSP10)